MGCGTSKAEPGMEVGASPAVPYSVPLEPEFTPETKPRPADAAAEIIKAKESHDFTAKRVDTIGMTGVSDFEDDTDVSPVTAMAKAYSVDVVQAVNVPAPPVTPPAAAKKPMFKSADALDDAEAESSYFPPQVSLNVGGSGGRQQQQQLASLPMQTSLQPFGLQPMPSTPSPATPPPPVSSVADPTLLRNSTSKRQLQPLPQQDQLKSPQQPFASRALPVLQGQPQPLTESGPGPSSGSVTSLAHPATAAAAGPSANDPWSSLQSTYRIREPHASLKESDAPQRGGGSRGAGKEVLVLGDDEDDEFSRGGGYGAGAAGSLNSTGMKRSSGYGGRPPLALPPPQFGSAPKKGGWGSGAMAQAGELMLGEDDWLVKDKPPGQGSLRGQPPSQQRQPVDQTVLAYNSRARLPVDEEERRAPVALKGPKKEAVKSKATDDVMFEDVEDVDTLLEDEMERQGLSNKNLVTKLAAYEAQFRDDDDE